jgi:hypothetical protein
MTKLDMAAKRRKKHINKIFVFSLFLFETLFCNRYLCRVSPYHLSGCTSSLRTPIINPGASPETAASTRAAWELTQAQRIIS